MAPLGAEKKKLESLLGRLGALLEPKALQHKIRHAPVTRESRPVSPLKPPVRGVNSPKLSYIAPLSATAASKQAVRSEAKASSASRNLLGDKESAYASQQPTLTPVVNSFRFL